MLSSKPSDVIMASASSIFRCRNNRYHVFLSCKGDDIISNSFVDRLCLALDKKDLITFRDDDSRRVDQGKTESTELLQRAMEESSVAIIIFSEGYAASVWCLDKLVKILDDENKVVIPVYYGVNASDVRDQRGNFGRGFFNSRSYDKTMEERSPCRKALVKAATIPGLQLAEGKEETTISEIMQRILGSGQIFTYPSMDEKSLDNCQELQRKNVYDEDKNDENNGGKLCNSVKSTSSSTFSSSVRSLSVFLSFHGEDTRKNYVDHLFQALHENGVFSLMGDGSLSRSLLSKSRSIAARLLEAIEESMYAIVLLTRGYISSPWCMRHLKKIMECKKDLRKIVVPVFIGIAPSEVRDHATPCSFRETFCDCKMDEVEEWRKALFEVTTLPRLNNRLDKDSISEIVKIVLSKLGIEEYMDMADEKKHKLPHNENLDPEIVTGQEESSKKHILQSPKESSRQKECILPSPEESLGEEECMSSSLEELSREEECILRRTYDVFLSFRGEDVRRTFADHLYSALDQRGIYTFKDDTKLKGGESIAPSIIKAIKESSIAIVIFTQNYADSSWCLDELVNIMNCHKEMKQTVLPVFYDVEPSEVRKQKGNVGKAFAKHGQESEVIWREALVQASSITGWELKNTANGHEAQCIKKIVDRVSDMLRGIHPHAHHEKLVGMEHRVHKLKTLLEIGLPDVRMIGIFGIGGGGKTTVARALFNDIPSDQFDGKGFVENVRERTQSLRMRELQEEVLYLVDKEIRVKTADEGSVMIRKRLGGRKVLLFLDDVDNIIQLEKLAGASDWFGKGSRVIITTRDKHVLKAHNITEIHEVDLFKDQEAIQLFSRYAFGRSSPKNGYEEYSHRVVRYAKGLPLTLRVLGGFLCGRNKPEWDSTMKRLEKVPNKETMDALRISYEGLEDEYKEVFLHVACLFRGWRIEEVSRILHSCEFHPGIALGVLKEKSLVTITNNCLGMHDRIQEMATVIVQEKNPDEAGRHSLLWAADKVWNILENSKGTDAIKSIVAEKMVKKEASDIRQAFRKMKKLRILHINTFAMKFQGPDSLPDTLRWLTWKYYNQRTLPKHFQANELVGLELPESEIEQLPDGEKGLGSLKFLNLSNSNLIQTPHFGSIPNLETLDLRYCSKLEKVHPSISYHRTLVSINLKGCESLESLPSRIGMKSLKSLDVSKCFKLKKLPEFSTDMDSLQELISSDNVIEEIPSSIGNLSNLMHLDVSYCEQLKRLPDTICGLEGLEVLDLRDCSSLEQLPKKIHNIKQLKIMV